MRRVIAGILAGFWWVSFPFLAAYVVQKANPTNWVNEWYAFPAMIVGVISLIVAEIFGGVLIWYLIADFHNTIKETENPIKNYKEIK
jgi:hypothetical protein